LISNVNVGSLTRFFLLTYGLAWAFFIPVAATAHPSIGPVQTLVLTVGAFAPAVVALWLTARTQGDQGVQRLVERALHWRVGARWYLLAVGYMAAIKLTVALVLRSSTGAWPRFGTEPWYLMVVAIAFSTPVQAGEEIGWRGYALPRLTARFGLRSASLLLGLIWACWHMPFFFVRGADTYGQPFAIYLLQVTAISVAMAWVYARTGSLLLVMLMHAAINNSKDIVPSGSTGAVNAFGLSASAVAWLTVAFLWVPAIYFLGRMPKKLPQDPPPMS
jgi:membrane protease YdiL (CAAX protease family)